MFLREFKKSRGSIATVILVLAIIVVIALAIAFFVVKRGQKPPQPTPEPEGPPPPVYNVTVNDINFTLLNNTNLGDTLFGKESRYPKSQKDIKTTERFIEVTVVAQNAGKVDTKRDVWNLGNIIDDKGRNFIPKSIDSMSPWMPADSVRNCGSILKPIFTPTPCVRIYDVAKGSTGLKIQVWAKKSADSSARTTELLDLKLTY